MTRVFFFETVDSKVLRVSCGAHEARERSMEARRTRRILLFWVEKGLVWEWIECERGQGSAP